MSESYWADVLIPGTAVFSWAIDGAACIMRALPEVVITDAPTSPEAPAAGAPLVATFPDRYELSFGPRPARRCVPACDLIA